MREAGLETDDIEVINPITGSTEYISKDDPSYYDSKSFTGRRYKGTSKPKEIPTFLWRGASKTARGRAKGETLLKEAAEKHDAAVAKERNYNRVINRLAASAESKPKSDENVSDDFIPASSPIRGDRMVETIAAETSFRISLSSCAFTFPRLWWQDPLDRRKSTTLLLPKPRSIRKGITLLVRVHGIIPPLGNGMMYPRKPSRTKQNFILLKSSKFVFGKGSELPLGDFMGKFKGRTVFQGNNVKDEALMQGILTWIRLPLDQITL